MEWIERIAGGYKRAADYEIEVYPKGDSNSEDYTCEIWIPVIKLYGGKRYEKEF